MRGLLTLQDPKQFLFFTRTANGRRAGKEFLARLKERTENRDKAHLARGPTAPSSRPSTAGASSRRPTCRVIRQPVLVANGESDRMVPTNNSVDLARRLPNADLVIYPDAGHGGIFQFHQQFVERALAFLGGALVNVEGATALVTGANRGLGAAIAQALVDAGAKVYGAARDNTTITNPDVIPVLLDVTSADDIANAARTCGDVSIVVNNAGIGRSSTSLAPDATDAARAELETNFFGPMRMAQAFAPVLRDNGGGALVNVLSVLSFISMPQARPTAHRRRPRGRSPTRCAWSCVGRGPSSSPCTPGSSTPTWPPASTPRRSAPSPSPPRSSRPSKPTPSRCWPIRPARW